MAQNPIKFFNDVPNIKDALKSRFSFLEIFFVVLIVSILGYVVVSVLSPAEIIRQSRDGQRMVELVDLSQAISLEKANLGSGNFGLLKTVYISVPAESSDCDYLSSNPMHLPELPVGWDYHCVSAASLRNVDGTGWVPLNLSNEMASFKVLPIDPVNNPAHNLFYSYYPGIGGYKVMARLESKKHSFDGRVGDLSARVAGGYGVLEKGTDLNIGH